MSSGALAALVFGSIFGIFALIFAIVFPIALHRQRQVYGTSPFTPSHPFGGITSWFSDVTEKPTRIARSPIAWCVIFFAGTYILLFGNSFSINAWINLWTDHRGILPFLAIIFVAGLFITSLVRSNILDKMPQWAEIVLLILMPTVLILSFIAHFLFFGYLEGTQPASQVAPQAAQRIVTAPAPTATPIPTPQSTVVEVELTGTEEFGVKLFELAPGQRARIIYEGGNVCAKHKSGKVYCADEQGFLDKENANYHYDDGSGQWRSAYRYSHAEDVRAGEMVSILGEPGSGNERVFQFLPGEDVLQVENASTKELPLYVYFNGLMGFYEDSSSFTFPNKETAEGYGHMDTHYTVGFQKNQYLDGSSARFRAEIPN